MKHAVPVFAVPCSWVWSVNKRALCGAKVNPDKHHSPESFSRLNDAEKCPRCAANLAAFMAGTLPRWQPKNDIVGVDDNVN